MYARGLGVTQSNTEALKWYLRAAAEGHPAAQYNVAFVYASGQGVPRSDQTALSWFRKSAAQGYAPAQVRSRRSGSRMVTI
jgi:TPR repeat protein